MADKGTKLWLSRASTCKVRSGCITCKHRHVKCDEAKPACNRCQNGGRICSGYQSSPIARLKESKVVKANKLAIPCQVAPLLCNPAIRLFETRMEQLYFDFFVQQTSHTLAGSIASVIWTSTVPQASVQNYPIRHAVVAIAALDKMARLAALDAEFRLPVGLSGFKQPTAKEHYNIAVNQYHRAVRAMRSELTNITPDHDIRNVLIFCLLTICFESYIGNQDAGNMQAVTGIELLSGWLRRVRPRHTFLVASGVSSPSPNVLEDDLIHAFIRLQQRAGMSNRAKTSWSIMDDEMDTAIKSMPGGFTSLKDAKISWELLERRIERLRICQAEAGQPDNFDSCYMFRSLTWQDPPDSSLMAEHVSAVMLWSYAFEPVLARSRAHTGHVDYLGATIVKMRSLIARPLLMGLSCETETAYDEFYLDFSQLFALFDSVLYGCYPTHPMRKVRFKFDIGMVPTLLYLIILCRHRTLRREALRMLEAYSCREGPWDSSMAVSIGRWVTETEEAGRQGDSVWIPESGRIRIYTFSYSPLQCRGILAYRMWQDGGYSASPPRQVELAW